MDTENKSGLAGIAVVVLVAAAVIGAFFLGHRQAAPATETTDELAGQRAGLQEFNDGIKAGDQLTKWVSGKIPPGSNYVKVYTNTSGRDVYADAGSIDIVTGETASSTVDLAMFASTTSAIPATQDFTALAEGKRALIQGVAVATSSTATSTNSTLAAVQGKGAGRIVIPNNSSLYVYMQQNTTRCSIAGAVSGAACETATSSNRGFNPVYQLRLSTYGLSF